MLMGRQNFKCVKADFTLSPPVDIMPATARMDPSWFHWQPTALMAVSTNTGSVKIG